MRVSLGLSIPTQLQKKEAAMTATKVPSFTIGAVLAHKNGRGTPDASDFPALIAAAEAAGYAAAEACTPRPMHVVDATSGTRYEPVMDGVCGFAWITIRPATSALAKYLKSAGKGRPAYGGGLQVWVSQFNQSMQKKEAYAYAYAKVLTEAGFNAYAGSRMD
jgi:hypothetical protein